MDRATHLCIPECYRLRFPFLSLQCSKSSEAALDLLYKALYRKGLKVPPVLLMPETSELLGALICT